MAFKSEETVAIPNKDLLSWAFDDQQYAPDKPIYVDAKNPSNSISSRQAKSIIRKLAAGFHAAGLVKGDCVCVNSYNDIHYPMLFLGIIAAGGIFSGTNPGYTKDELSHHIKTSRTKFFITEPEMLQTVLAAAEKTHLPKNNIWIFDVHQQEIPQGFKSWRDLMTYGEKDWERFDDEYTSKNTPAARLFSSGTTGLPKAATLSHYNLIAQHTLVVEIDKRPYETSGLFYLPMFHAATVPIAHTSPLRAGYLSYVMRRFEVEPFLSYYQKYQITDIRSVPPVIISIIMSPITPRYSLKSVRWASCGAAPLGKENQLKFKKLLHPNAVFSQVWGMTETTCVASKFYHPEGDETGSIGRLMPNLEGKLIGDDGEEITEYNKRGEICVRGPTVMQGYFENPGANAEAFDSEGYFKTGDIAYCDAETKKWYIVDRRKELIKVRGFQVAPPEIENVLLSHPLIIDAAVIGIKHSAEPDVEHPRAYVVRRPESGDEPLDEKIVKNYCGERLAKYKALTGGVIFMKSIPKNASGKILKRVLRDMAEAESASQPKGKL